MDANGTKFHLLLGKRDWGRSTDHRGLELGPFWDPPHKDDGERPLLDWDEPDDELVLGSRLFEFQASRNDRPVEIEARRGAARDLFGNWYWIGESGGELLVYSSGSRKTSHFWAVCDGVACERTSRFGHFRAVDEAVDPAPVRLRGLAVTEDNYLVVGALEPAGLLIFDLHAGGPPIQWLWPVDFAPFDMAARYGGGVWILDRREEDSRYWGLDRHFNVISRDQSMKTLAAAEREAFQPVTPDPKGRERLIAARTFPSGITLKAPSPLPAIDAIAIEALPDDTVLILDRRENERFSVIYRFRHGEQLGDPASTDVIEQKIEREQQGKFKLIAHDFAFVREQKPGEDKPLDKLYVAVRGGNQSFAFQLSFTGEQLSLVPIMDYLPMRAFRGKALAAAGEQVYYDFDDRWIPLVKQCRPRYAPEATINTPAFDGAEPDCVWHRLLLDASIPPTARVEVRSRTARKLEELNFAPWQREPEFYLRRAGTELPYLRQNEERATYELLLQRARGRFLQLEIKLIGDGRTTPRLFALRVYYPRFSYLAHYLPAVYREEETSASFLDRFLANFEGVLTGIEDRIAATQILFDWRSAPPEALDWLAGWFEMATDPAWDEWRKRLLIKYAMEFFRYRGTVAGLRMALRLALDETADDTIFTCAFTDGSRHGIRIIEKFRTRRTPSVALGDPTAGAAAGAAGAGGEQLSTVARWAPSAGAAELHLRYRKFLRGRYRSAVLLPDGVTFPIRDPEWQRVPTGGQSEVNPIAALGDQELWRDFLKRRYLQIEALRSAHGTNYAGFEAVAIPARLTSISPVLRDWNDFITEKAAVWRQFSEAALGFVPSAIVNEQRLWQEFLASRYRNIEELNDTYDRNDTSFAEVPLPVSRPAAGRQREDWDAFTAMTGATVAAIRRRWQDFLARRHRSLAELNRAHRSNWTDFSSVSLPGELPAEPAVLQDWFQFEGVVQVMHNNAHRFTVLLPLPPQFRQDEGEQRRRREIAQRIIAWERPAHTVFDVKFYWNLFRVGEVRLGKDTVLDQGSRSPQFAQPLILGQSFIGENWLAPGHPQNVKDRQMLGRDALVRRQPGPEQEC